MKKLAIYKIIFYKDKKGNEPVKEFILKLKKSGEKDKNARINFDKITDYLDVLSKEGLKAGMPYIKHIKGDIWELRPLRNRVFFFSFKGDTFVMLSHFLKKTQETPEAEKDKAEKLMKRFLKGE